MYSSIKRFIILLSAVLWLPPIIGCTTGGHHDVDTLTVATDPTLSAAGRETKELNQKLFANARVNSDPSDYLLGAGDLLSITVFEAEELTTKVRVSSRGNITLPLIGQVKVKGRSAREAEVLIENLYSEKYLKNPHVSVFVEEHFSQRVTLVGQFNKPGTYDYISKMRLLDVMALGGGLSEKAGRTVQIRRVGDSPDESGSFIVDLDKLIREGEGDLNIEINGGDVVFVPEAGMFFVDGAVRKPGAYAIKQKTALPEALSVAGGLAPYAADAVVLIRHLGNGERKVVELDMDDPTAYDTFVSDRDIIIVKASTLGRFVHGLGINIGIPGLGFGYKDPVR